MGKREDIAVDKRRKRKYRRLARYEKKSRKAAAKETAKQEKARRKAEKREKRKFVQGQKSISGERIVKRQDKARPDHTVRQKAVSGTISRSQKKMDKKAEEKRLSAQKSIPYREMARDGICRVQDKYYSKTIRFYDINYQLAQNEDKNAIFENWCDFLNYFDSSIHFQLSFINHHSNMKEFESVIQIKPRHDAFDDVRMEYAQMLKNQLAKGNNGLVRTKYITFGVEAENIREAKPN